MIFPQKLVRVSGYQILEEFCTLLTFTGKGAKKKIKLKILLIITQILIFNGSFWTYPIPEVDRAKRIIYDRNILNYFHNENCNYMVCYFIFAYEK